MECTLPETNSSPLKMDGWKMTFLLGWPIFRGHVSFRECKISKCQKRKKKQTNNNYSRVGFLNHTFLCCKMEMSKLEDSSQPCQKELDS